MILIFFCPHHYILHQLFSISIKYGVFLKKSTSILNFSWLWPSPRTKLLSPARHRTKMRAKLWVQSRASCLWNRRGRVWTETPCGGGSATTRPWTESRMPCMLSWRRRFMKKTPMRNGCNEEMVSPSHKWNFLPLLLAARGSGGGGWRMSGGSRYISNEERDMCSVYSLCLSLDYHHTLFATFVWNLTLKSIYGRFPLLLKFKTKVKLYIYI